MQIGHSDDSVDASSRRRPFHTPGFPAFLCSLLARAERMRSIRGHDASAASLFEIDFRIAARPSAFCLSFQR